MIRCYGILPLRREGEEWMLLLVLHRKGFWGVPKGHGEEGETAWESAQRELCEETGLHVMTPLNLPPFEEFYYIEGQPKCVTYYAAQVIGSLVLQVAEVSEARWVRLDEAADHVTFPSSRLVIEALSHALISN